MIRRLLKKSIIAVLTLEARLVVRKYEPHIVAITGSVGKTSTKDAVYAVLAGQYHVRRSEKSFNSEVGLPLTILGCPNAWNNPFRWLQNIFDGLFLIVFPAQYPQWLVLEVGADRPNDIRSVARWLSVDIAVITRLPEVPVHVEFFDSPQAVVEEKAALIDALKPGGTLVLFADDERTNLLRARAQARGAKVVTFGLTAAADVRGVDIATLCQEDRDLPVLPTWEAGGRRGLPIGMRAHIEINGVSVPFSLVGTLGNHMILSVVAAAAVGGAIGKDLADIVDALRHYDPPAGRMRLLRGVKETLLIDDTYNSSPAATVAALDALAGVAAKRKIVVLGDMLELGRHSVEEHRKIGAYVAGHARGTSNKIDILVTVGFRARDIAEGALDNGLPDSAILQYEDAEKAGDELERMLASGDCVLVKGSQSMRMERVVEELMNEPERAAELLVRQDAEWKRR